MRPLKSVSLSRIPTHMQAQLRYEALWPAETKLSLTCFFLLMPFRVGLLYHEIASVLKALHNSPQTYLVSDLQSVKCGYIMMSNWWVCLIPFGCSNSLSFKIFADLKNRMLLMFQHAWTLFIFLRLIYSCYLLWIYWVFSADMMSWMYPLCTTLNNPSVIV